MPAATKIAEPFDDLEKALRSPRIPEFPKFEIPPSQVAEPWPTPQKPADSTARPNEAEELRNLMEADLVRTLSRLTEAEDRAAEIEKSMSELYATLLDERTKIDELRQSEAMLRAGLSVKDKPAWARG
jgi:hypothetical protein